MISNQVYLLHRAPKGSLTDAACCGNPEVAEDMRGTWGTNPPGYAGCCMGTVGGMPPMVAGNPPIAGATPGLTLPA